MEMMDQGVMTAVRRRGSRSDAPPVRPTLPAVVKQSPLSPPVAVSAPAPPRTFAGRDWIGPVVALTIGALLSLLAHERIGIGYEAIVLGAAGAAAITGVLLHRRAKHRPPPPAAGAPPTPDQPAPAP